MNLFGCLLPCSLKRGWWNIEETTANNGAIRTDLLVVHRGASSSSSAAAALAAAMGANASNTSAAGGSLSDLPLPQSLAAQTNAPGIGSGASTIADGVMVRERKKKVTGFATLRKKFIRRRRSSKACDHGRMLRELVADWSPLELAALLEEYEALAALKDLSFQAELARPPATTFKQDLSALYDFKYCTDADLVFRGACFPIHRALLSARCPYFRDLLAGCPGYGARICLELNRTASLDVQLFSALLRYLYTGDICPHESNIDLELLRRLGDEFGTPNPLEHDLRYLLETGDYADAALVFTSDGSDYQRPDSGSSEYGFRPKLELPCHKAILSARSPFFRNLIQRRSRTGEEHTERALHIPTRIVLDECVIPKRYARVLLHAIYLDTVDLSLILRGSNSGIGSGSLGEVQALTHTGRMRPSPLEEAMELYQIGRFLELDILVQGCEDIIIEWLSLNSLPTVLRWSSQPHGSAWVHRQALHFLREEFHLVAQSPVLYQLDKEHLINVLKSNFLQASELEVLQAILKWGEHELTRRMEDREPNLLSHTAHSVARKGVKKRDLSDVELREILSDLFPLVRMDHVLPQNSEVLTQAIKRGLVSTPPSHIIGDDRENLRVNAWIRCRNNNGLFVRPRFFMPYYEELKLLVEDQLVQEVQRLRMHRYMPDIPDTLYMVEDKPRVAANTAGLDVLAAALPVPDAITLCAMLKRVSKLKQTPICQRAIASPLSSRAEINRQIKLRVVREFNLPDAVADMLDNTAVFRHEEHDHDRSDSNLETSQMCSSPERNASVRNQRDISTGPQSLAHGPICYGRNLTFPRFSGANSSGRVDNTGIGSMAAAAAGGSSIGGQRNELPAIVTEGDTFRHLPGEPESSSCSDGHLSDIMPDVAMATASFGQLQLQEQQELELDLGDGASHMHNQLLQSASGAATSSASSNNPFLVEPPPPTSSRGSIACYRYLGNMIGPSINYYSANRVANNNVNNTDASNNGLDSGYHTGPPRYL